MEPMKDGKAQGCKYWITGVYSGNERNWTQKENSTGNNGWSQGFVLDNKNLERILGKRRN